RDLGRSVHHQYGKGHTLNFCLPICHSRASPFGSSTKKTIIKAPTITKVNCSAAAGWIGRPKAAGTARSAIGKMEIKEAPKKEPTNVPKPPIITLKKTR